MGLVKDLYDDLRSCLKVTNVGISGYSGELNENEEFTLSFKISRVAPGVPVRFNLLSCKVSKTAFATPIVNGSEVDSVDVSPGHGDVYPLDEGISETETITVRMKAIASNPIRIEKVAKIQFQAKFLPDPFFTLLYDEPVMHNIVE